MSGKTVWVCFLCVQFIKKENVYVNAIGILYTEGKRKIKSSVGVGGSVYCIRFSYFLVTLSTD